MITKADTAAAAKYNKKIFLVPAELFFVKQVTGFCNFMATQKPVRLHLDCSTAISTPGNRFETHRDMSSVQHPTSSRMHVSA